MLRLFKSEENGKEVCFCVEADSRLTDEEKERLLWLAQGAGPRERVSFGSFLPPDSKVIEVGPRLAFETPFSTNAVSICSNIGLKKVVRFEKVDRCIENGQPVVFDRMTQMVYGSPVSSFIAQEQPEPIIIVPVLEKDLEALQEANLKLGLGFDRADMDHIMSLYKTKYCRNPTDTELFDRATCNSDHSRHHVWNGLFIIDGMEMPESLLQIIKSPWKSLEPGHNSLKGFNDNSGVIRGHKVEILVPEHPGRPSKMILRTVYLHITHTAETHNHPTLSEPFEGAQTGSGGRIRDNVAVGIGARAVAGLAGYCVGVLPMDDKPGWDHIDPARFPYADPLRILLEASRGVHSYGNKIGEPLIGGYTRNFGLIVDGERLEFAKPVLYSAGVGRIWDEHLEKKPPTLGQKIVFVGGGVHRVGVGGGNASSMHGGTNDLNLDFNSVQRGNPEMENRVNRAIRTNVEMGAGNLIASTQDQGAGGIGNAGKEIIHPAGGVIDLRNVNLADPTLSDREIWCAEAQERYALLVDPENVPQFKEVCDRERVPCEILGDVTGNGQVTVLGRTGEKVIEFDLGEVLGDVPRKSFHYTKRERKLQPLLFDNHPRDLSTLCRKTFALLEVGSKGFLTRHVDRSVTGLIAQQQCCGPVGLAVSDNQTVLDSFRGMSGSVTAIGENPKYTIINPAAGSRMALAEMITNIAGVRTERGLADIKIRANYMGPAKLEHEGPRLYEGYRALRDMMMQIKGLAADGGKDSSSMAVKYLGRLIPSPAELVIEGTAPVPDVTRRVTPDLKARGDSSLFLIDIGAGKDRLGGSSLAYALGQLGDESPDIDDVQRLIAAYECVQWLLDEGKILSLHDRSDGGLLATLAEMSLAGNVGIEYILGASTWLGGIKRLFNQEAGWVLEAQTSHELDIVSLFNQFKVPCRKIGSTSPDRQFIVRSTSELGMNIHLAELREMYEATSDKLEAMQVNPAVVEKRRKTYIPVHESPDPVYTATFTPERNFPAIGQAYNPSVCILREEGTNGDDEMRAAFFEAGFNPYDVCMQDLVSGKTGLDGFQGIVFCGGFSYMDVLDSAKGWAATILHDPRLRAMFERFYIRSDTFSLGVCNGFQLMTQLGWLPTPKAESDQPRLVHNDSGVFESGWTSVRIAKSPSILFKGMEGSVLPVWYAHGEGKLVIPKRQYESVKRNNLIPLYYADLDGAPTMEYPYCPNGSLDGIAALCSPDGRHTGMMPHPERCFRLQTWQWTSKSLLDQVGGVSPWLTFFQNARPWCLSHRR